MTLSQADRAARAKVLHLAPGEARAQPAVGKPAVKRLDWTRIKADHATGQYSDLELAELHKTSRTVISRRRSLERRKDPSSWAVDRSEDVKRATQALLMQESVEMTLSAGQTAGSVLATATAVAGVILGHRREITAARSVVMGMLAQLETTTTAPALWARTVELASEGLDDDEMAGIRAQARELLKLHNRAGSALKLVDAITKLHAGERRAFGLEDGAIPDDDLSKLSIQQLQGEIGRIRARLADSRLTVIDNEAVQARD
jgi:hypothetical protein